LEIFEFDKSNFSKKPVEDKIIYLNNLFNQIKEKDLNNNIIIQDLIFNKNIEDLNIQDIEKSKTTVENLKEKFSNCIKIINEIEQKNIIKKKVISRKILQHYLNNPKDFSKIIQKIKNAKNYLVLMGIYNTKKKL
jgi:hypothetical protein